MVGFVVGCLAPLLRLYGYWLDRETRSTAILALVPNANQSTSKFFELRTVVDLETLTDGLSKLATDSV